MGEALVRLKAPRDHGCVGFAGVEYAVRDGFVEVPEAAAAVLRAHGYKPAAAAPAGGRFPRKKG
jgi:hypothetical protein